MKKNNTYDRVTDVTRRKTDTVERQLRNHRPLKGKKLPPLSPETIRVTPLGGQDGIGEKNMIVVEYGNDALILDCGFDLGINLPGINYAIPVTEYLQSIRHKLRGYVISHGHMDHIGALTHVVPQFPAPIYGSQFTIGMIEAQFEKAAERGQQIVPECHVLNMDAHEKIRLGQFMVELVRITHSIPESSAIVVDTPIGRIINTGDFRLDPEPLDIKPSDVARLKELGDEGVLLLMSESTNTTKLGRTPTEHTLQESFHELMDHTTGRMIIAVFSTNMNRIQMIIDAAHQHGRKVVLDGRSMLAVAEMAVRLGSLKIPKGVLIPMREAQNTADKHLVIVCTGGQGEPGAALSRMAAGEHRFIKLKPGDSVVVSSTPIPGNEQNYADIGDKLARLGVKQYRHPTYEIDGSGPLHVSGHASRDEHTEMIALTRPRYLMPIYGGPLPRYYHQQIGLAKGMSKDTIIMAENGEVIDVGAHKQPTIVGRTVAGAHLVDQTGAIVPEIVTRDRLLLKEDGFVVVAITVNRTGRLLLSPDIVTRGHVAVRDNVDLMQGLRREVQNVVSARNSLGSRAAIDLLKNDIRIAVTRYLFNMTAQTPITVCIVNVIAKDGTSNNIAKPVADVHS